MQKQYREAAEQYEVFANNNSSTKEVIYALYWSGWCYYEAASADETLFSKSRDAFQKLIDNYGDNPYTSKARERLCDIEEAESDKAIIDAEEAVHNAKQSNCRSRSIDTAIKDLDNAKQKQERGNYKAALRLAQEARDTAKRVTDKHETAKRYVEQGYNHLRQKQLETATEKAREALRIHPPYQNAKQLLEEIKQKYFDQGVNYIETKEERKAISPLKKAIDIDSQFKEAYYNLGFAYLQLGEFPQVITAANALKGYSHRSRLPRCH